MTLSVAAEMDALTSRVPPGSLIRLRDMHTGFIGTSMFSRTNENNDSFLIRKNGHCLIREEVPYIYLGCSADNDYMLVHMLFWKGIEVLGGNFRGAVPGIITIPFSWDELARKVTKLDWLIEVIRIPDP